MGTERLAVLVGAALVLAAVTASRDVHAAEVVSIGTLAPKKSPWGKVFGSCSKTANKRSGGKLALKLHFNAQQGDEKAMVAKIRTGQLDGAAVTSVGLGMAHKPMLAMGMPGLFSDWATLDKARAAMTGPFCAALKKKGFYLPGYGDVGLARTLSKGKAIRTPNDLKSMKVFRWADDPMGPVAASKFGYGAIPSSIPGLLPNLSSGQSNVITVPSLVAVQLQWWTHLGPINDDVAGGGVGGLLLSKQRVDGLPRDLGTLVVKTASKAGEMVTKRVRREDQKAFKMLKSRLTLVTLTKSEKTKWASAHKKVRLQLTGRTFPKALVKKLEGLAGS